MLLRDLDFFISIAESGSFRRAAVQADVTQPAITKGIRRLEAELGVSLLARSRKGTVLTDAGLLFLKRAHHLREYLADSLREAREMSARGQGLLRIGVAPSLVETFFRHSCSICLEQRPATRFSLQIALSDELFIALRRGDLDLVLCSMPPSAERLFSVHPIGFSTLMVVADKTHPVLAAGIPLQELTAFGWVLPRRGVLARDWIDGVFLRHGLPLPVATIEVDTHTDALLPLVAGSELLSIASLPRGRGGLPPGLANVAHEDLILNRRVAVLTRPDYQLSPLAQHFIDVVAASAAGSPDPVHASHPPG